MVDFNPYESPQEVEPRRSFGQQIKGGAFVPARSRAIFAVVMLVVMAVLHVVDTVNIFVNQATLTRSAPLWREDVRQELKRAQTRNRIMAATWLAMIFVTVIAFLAWVRRAYKNLPSLGAKGLEYTPGSAVSSFLIPPANLVAPYTVMSELWRNSHPDGIGVSARATSAALVAWWWIVLIVGNVFGLLLILYASSDLVESLLTILILVCIRNLIGIAAALLAILMVMRIDANQLLRFEIVSSQNESDGGGLR